MKHSTRTKSNSWSETVRPAANVTYSHHNRGCSKKRNGHANITRTEKSAKIEESSPIGKGIGPGLREVKLWYTNASSLGISAGVLTKFNQYRQDRGDGRQGGGALLLVDREYVQWEHPSAINTPNIQAIGCQIIIDRKQIGIMCVYRAPMAEPAETDSMLDALSSFVESSKQFYVGNGSEKFLDWVYSKAYTQHVHKPTRFREGCEPSLLDLVVTRYENDVSDITFSDPLGKSDHCVVQLTIPIDTRSRICKYKRNYHHIDETRLITAAREMRWYPEGTDTGVEARWQCIREGIAQLTERFAPLEIPRLRSRPKWWKPRVARAIRHRTKCWRYYWHNSSTAAWERYKTARNKAQAVQRRAKRTYEELIASRVKDNPKVFYAYAQDSKKTREDVGVLEVGTTRVIATVPTLTTFEITVDDVSRELTSLDRHKAAGEDGLHPAIIKPLSEVLSAPIKELYRLSMDTGILPNDWKKAQVVAIHKSGSKKLAKNYRPVSLTRLDVGLPVEVCYMDFSKAFDSVSHKLLAQKLLGFGLAGSLYSWIVDFLSGRTFHVRVGGASSESAQ
ncbi:uncharacterized protein LOC134788438, partial [Penaeus indicus]|uniref:uncharacterized protein LOC134788438 n=1 Tax=Penaeus indicus TaxID=29960 RepID=UPI00300CC4B3